MVANIYTGETPAQEFARELKGMMKKAALRMDCDVEELKYRTNNAGVVEISKMTEQEMIDLHAQEAIDKRTRKIREIRNG